MLRKVIHRKEVIPLILFFFGFCVTVLISVRLWNFLLDDTFIDFRYAQNISQGKGIVFNPGEFVDGYTNFLWVLYQSIFFFLHIDPVITVKITDIFLTLSSAILLYFVGRITYFKNSLLLAVIPSFLFLISPYVGISASEGLETLLFIFLLLLTVFLFLRENGKGFPFSALSLAFLSLTRPDGLIFIPVFLIIMLYRKVTARYFYFFLGTVLSIFGIFFIMHYFYYKELLPNSYYAKKGGSLELIKKGTKQTITFVEQSGAWIFLFYVFSLFNKKIRSVTVLLIGIVLVRVLFNIWSGGAWMGFNRFLVPVLPFVYLLAFGGLFYAVQNKISRLYTMILVIGIFLIPLILYIREWEPSELNYGKSLQIAHVRLGKDIQKNTTKNAITAIGDDGAVPFYSQRINIDMLGLTDKHIAHLPHYFYSKIDPVYILSRQPDIIILTAYKEFPKFKSELGPNDAALLFNKKFNNDYQFVRSYIFLPNVYYLLVYKRNDSTAFINKKFISDTTIK